MNFIDTLFYYLGFDISYGIAFVAQIICLIPLCWYVLYKSLKIIWMGCKIDYKEQGVIPVLSMLYLLISAWFILNFISNFDELSALNERILRNNIEGFRELDLNFYVTLINIFSALIFAAFTFNLFKAFYSINSLEHGYFQNINLKNILSKNKLISILETIVRIVIAGLLLVLEQIFSKDILTLNNNPQYFFQLITVLGSILYVFLIIWHIVIYKSSKQQRLVNFSTTWKTCTIIQLFGGLLLFAFFFFFGKETFETELHYMSMFWMIILVGLVCPIMIVGSIIWNEVVQFKRNKKYMNNAAN